MAIERIDSLFSIEAIQAEFAAVKTGLADSQKSLTDLYATIKGFKDTSLSTLADNSAKLSQAITGTVEATKKAAQNYDALSQKIAQQTSFIKDNATSLVAQAAGYDQLIKQAIRNKLAMDDLAKSQKEAKMAFDAGTTSFADYTASLESIRAAQQTLKTSNADITKALNNLEKQAQNSGTSLDGMRAKLNLLMQAYDKLGTEGRGSEQGQALLKNIQETDAAIKQLEADSGRFQRNVGNYSGAFQEAFAVLKQQLEAVKNEMGQLETKGKTVVNNLTGGNPIGFDPNKFKGQVTNLTSASGGSVNLAAGDAGTYQQLSQKAQLLESNIERLSVGFKTTRQEARAFQEAAVQLGLAIGQESEEFLVFDKAVGHTQKGINDIKEATKFQSSDAKFIKGLADAASTLAGGFAAAQAAGSLLAGEDEDLQKQFAKFQQLLVLVNGLQAVANGLQTESGGIQLLLAARTSLLNAAKATQQLITTRAIQVIAAETAATEVNAEVKQADAAATAEQAVVQEGQTAAVIQNTEATIANTAAQGAAKGATTSLSTAFVAGGIAALAIGAGVALAILTAKLIGYGERIGITVKQQKEILDATKELNDSLEGQAKIFDQLDSSQRRYYANLISDAQDAGASQYALLLAQQRFDQQQADAAKAEVDRLGATDAAYSRAANDVQRLRDAQSGYAQVILDLNKIPEKDQTRSQKAQIKAAQDNLQLNKTQLEIANDTFDRMKAAREKFQEFTQKATSDETKFNKISLDEQLDNTAKAEELRANLVKARNAIILSDNASSYRQRIDALKSNLHQENAILEGQAAKIKGSPNNFINGLPTPQAQQQLNAINEQRKEAAIKNADEISKVNRAYYERDRDARLAVYKSGLEQQVSLEDNILNKKIGTGEGEASSADQLTALRNRLANQKRLVEADRDEDLDKEGITNEEKAAIKKKANDALYALDIKYLDDARSLNKKILDATLADWDQYYQERKTQIDKESNAEIKALNDRLQKRKISQQKYDDERKTIEDKNAVASINLTVLNDYIKLQSFKEGTKERADAEAKLTTDLGTQSDLRTKQTTDQQDIARRKVERTFQDIQSQSQAYGSAIVDVIDIGYNTQKVRLEELEVRQQRAYEQQVKNINDSSATEEQKAIRLKILDDQRAVQKEQNDRKQRQLDLQKAQFDKAKDVLNIITGTALAVVKALPNIPLAVAVGILGAAELAAAIATPLPHYKEGTEDHPGGKAVVGDGGVPELIAEPGKPMRWSASTPTIESLAKHTKVIPPHKIEEMAMKGLFVNHEGALIAAPSDNKKELREIREAIVWSAQQQKEIAKASHPRIVNKITVTAGWHSYVQNSVFK